MDSRRGNVVAGKPLREPARSSRCTGRVFDLPAMAARYPCEPLQIVSGDLGIDVVRAAIDADPAGNAAGVWRSRRLLRMFEQLVGDT